VTHYIDLQATACQIAGQIEQALSLVDDALQIVERTGERWLEAELNRHKGQLLLRQGHAEVATELITSQTREGRHHEIERGEGLHSHEGIRSAISRARGRALRRRRRTRQRRCTEPTRAMG
jgi:predicted ATPase